MALKNILISLDNSETTKQNAKLTLAAMYLEETLNEGLSIEIV